MQQRLWIVAALIAGAAAPVPTAAELERGLAGNWRGTLGYRDYQTDKLFELAVETEIRAVPDGATVLRISRFDEGPRRDPVYIVTADLHDSAAGTVASTTLRKGRAAELGTHRLSVAKFTDVTHWTILEEEDGRDDDRPARLRVTEVRDGDRLTATKEVLPEGATSWAFRNVTKLERMAR